MVVGVLASLLSDRWAHDPSASGGVGSGPGVGAGRTDVRGRGGEARRDRHDLSDTPVLFEGDDVDRTDTRGALATP